jgi:ATP-binding cassette subfamily C protein/ATP-binding cassette subfamily C protein EexD
MLSGGQRQRIGLARALYGGPSLLVLDEPNSSLDALGEDALNEAIRAMKEAGTTVVVIAHRPSLMMHVNKIIVLNDGRVELFGERNVVLTQMQRNALQAAGNKKLQAVTV